jgi:hypothetical protein
MNWTATAVNSGTQFAVVAEGADANVAAGAIVIEVLSAGALDQIKADAQNGFPFTVVQQCAVAEAITQGSWVFTWNQATAASGNTAWLIVSSDGTSSFTAPSGWTVDFDQQQNNDARLVIMHKATASDTSATIATGSAVNLCAWFFELAGSHAIDQSSISGTAGLPTTGSFTGLPFAAITPTAGAAIFAFAAVTEIGPTFPLVPLGSGAWLPVNIQPSGNGFRSLFGYVANFAGAGVSVTPPPLLIPPLLYAGGGIAYGTFSIL